MKRKFASFLCFILFLCLFPIDAFADDTGGSGNLDGGGGGMGNGTSECYWNPSMDGVRVTVINAETRQPETTPIDFTNKHPTVNLHFGKVCKIQYRNSTALSVKTSAYTFYNPALAMPLIISSGSGKASIDAIKSYFCDELVVRYIAQITGMNYDTLISGQYKLLLEPIAYFMYNGTNFAMTAHEAAMYDNQVSGALRSKMASLSHKNLPLAMFLEYSDLGFSAYTGSTTTGRSNDTIIANLGLGIVRFTDELPNNEETDYTYEYRVNTDVITPVTLYASGEINPDNPARVTFRININNYTVSNIVIPEGESQLVWVKWHTPSTPQNMTITANTTEGVLSQTTISTCIIDLSSNDPPDPKATDTRGNWSSVNVPSRETKSSAIWSVWSASWHANWVWVPVWVWVGGEYGHWVDNGYWEDQGWYDFTRNNYSASITVSMNLSPDDKAPTAGSDSMKSGYGVNNNIAATVSTSAPSSHFTYAQTAISCFPEFNYETYWRLLDCTLSSKTAKFEFAANKYSTYNNRVHFCPIWYPDGNYTVNTYVMDIWTPAGMLCANLSDDVRISGSLYDDWHIGVSH